MVFKALDIVILKHEIQEYGLKKGALGTIVEIYGDGDSYEVEFIDKNGKTNALLTLNSSDISPKLNTSRVEWNETLVVDLNHS